MDRVSTLSLLRNLYRELRPTLNMGQKHVYGTQQWKYILSVAREGNPEEAQRLFTAGQNYLSYLQSTRNYQEIQLRYKGKGERSPDEMAQLMGFSMPDQPRQPRKNKSEA